MRFPFRSPPKRHLPSPRDFPFVELCGGETRVLVVPSLGGKIAELWTGAHQWFWQNPVIPLDVEVNAGSYLETGDTGGLDECFPTVGGCRVPGWVRGFGGIELPDHGELWSQAPLVEVRTHSAGQRVRCRWTGVRLPYHFEREVQVDAAGVVHLHYALTNDGHDKMPFVWAAHPLFPLTDDTRVVLPEGSRLRVFARHGIELGEVRSEHQWPHVRGSGKVYDFVEPHDVARRYACKFFLDISDGTVALRQSQHELRFAWNVRDIPQVGMWINKRGWTPFRDEEAYLNLSIQPAIGAPDTLSEALGDWKSAAWIEPGATRRWSLSLSASKLGGDEEEAT